MLNDNPGASVKKNFPSVSIIIPNWNGAALLEECLRAAESACAAYPAPTEIIVSDNASTDDSVKIIRDKFPNVHLVTNERNEGFSINANRSAAPAKHDILYLINSDVIVNNETLGLIVEHFDDPEVFAAASKSFSEDGSIREARKTKLFKTIWFVKGLRHDRHNKDTEGPCLQLMATGGHSAMRREMFESLGGFDPLFTPFYWEDSDLSHRAWRRGWKIIYDPRSTVVHKHKSVIHERHKLREIHDISHRNKMIFIWKDISEPGILLPHFIGLFFRVLFCVPRMDVPFMKSLAAALKLLGPIRKKRRHEKALWKLGDAEALRLSSGDHDYKAPIAALLRELKNA